MAMLRTLMSLAVTATLMNVAVAANYTVGGANGGWDTSTNLQSWASSQSMSTGDNLVFQYMPNHDVLEVSKADYDSCQSSNPIQTYTGGNTVIPLTSPGKRYFICGTMGHCSQGMKVEIDTLATSAPPPASPATPPPAETPATPPPAETPATPPPASPVTPVSSPPRNSLASAPTMSPQSPPKSPVSSPTPSLVVPSTESHATSPSPSGSAPPPPSSSATKVHTVLGSTMGFSFAMLMVMNL